MLAKKTIFLRTALYLLGIMILVLAMFWLPRLAHDTTVQFPEFSHLKSPVLLGIYATMIPFFYAIYQADYLLRLIAENEAFAPQGIIFLQRIIYCAYAIISHYLVGGIYLFINFALHPGIVLVGAGILFVCTIVIILALILQQLLKQIIQIKSENELTI